MIKGIKFASIPVRDQNKALEFYTQKLGFQVQTDQAMGPGQRWIELKIPGADTMVVLFTMEEHKDWIGKQQSIVFWADNVEKTYAELVGRGVTFAHPPKKEPWGMYTTFADPDGNKFVLGTK
jgi:predicted enzyme related to lactoylglutathione lyase